MSNIPVIAGMATTRDRKEAMWEAIETLHPQVDLLYVYVNDGTHGEGYHVTSKVAFMDGPRLFGDMGDAGKFAMATTISVTDRNAYFFAVDDDIKYPNDYTSYLISCLNEYEDNRVVGLHGKIVNDKISTYYRDKTNMKWLHHKMVQSDNIPVHILGTGLLAFNLKRMVLRMEEIMQEPRNAADIHFAIACQRRAVGMVCVAHDAEYIKLSDKIDHAKDTIWGRSRNNDQEHTNLVNSINWQIIL